MILGERHHPRIPAAIQVPPWPSYDDVMSPPPPSPFSHLFPVSGVSNPSPGGSGDLSPYLLAEGALSRFLPSNDPYFSDDDSSSDPPAMDAYSCDEFRMYEFKVRRCARGRSHDWTECPYAHPGEKARRRDPRKYHYSGTACPDFRKGSCKRGGSCEFAHGVFECWLHPARYRTQPCKDGVGCRRRVCFFAHTPEQLRVLPQQQQQSPRASAAAAAGACDSYDGSPMRQQHLASLEAYFPKSLMSSASPTSTLVSPPVSPPSDSPPLSPSGAPPMGMRRAVVASPGSSVNEVLASLRQLQLSKAKSGTGGASASAWMGSPRGVGAIGKSGFCSGPTTPTGPVMGGGLFDGWDEPVERVESGRDLRARIAERLSKENSLDRASDDESAAMAAPDVGWVSDLLN